MANALGRALLLVGVALLAHAGYSAVHFKRLVEQHYGDVDAGLPVDCYVELVAAFAAIVGGALLNLGSFASAYAAGGAPLECVGRLLPEPVDRCDCHRRCARCRVRAPCTQRLPQAVRRQARLRCHQACDGRWAAGAACTC
jgi:hypothetical protein